MAERTGIAQSDISKLENGNSNPTLGMLKRLADGMGMTVKLQFVPKAQRKTKYQSNREIYSLAVIFFAKKAGDITPMSLT